MKNIVDSTVNVVDGGSVFQAEVGYATEITLTQDTSFAYKKWVIDNFSPVGAAFVPLPGTNPGQPVTGPLTFDNSVGEAINAFSGTSESYVYLDGNETYIGVDDTTNGVDGYLAIAGDGSFTLSADNGTLHHFLYNDFATNSIKISGLSGFTGLLGAANYSATYQPNHYVQKVYTDATYQPLLGYTAENISNRGLANGYTPLDSTGKISTTYLPAAVLGGANYQGTWDASVNSPSLSSGTGTKGYYYVVGNPGATNLDGITDWKLGDWAIYNGTAWNKVDNTDAVISVNGMIGSVPLTGTANRVTVSASNVFDIASTYVGQNTITTLGTIGTGIWQGSSISTTYTDAKIKGSASVTNGVFFQNGTADTASNSTSFTFDGTTVFSLNGMAIGSGSPTIATDRLLDISKNQNLNTHIRVINQGTGTAGSAALNLQNSTGSGWLYKLSSGYTTAGIYMPGILVLDNNGDIGLNASTGKAIYFGNNGSTIASLTASLFTMGTFQFQSGKLSANASISGGYNGTPGMISARGQNAGDRIFYTESSGVGGSGFITALEVGGYNPTPASRALYQFRTYDSTTTGNYAGTSYPVAMTYLHSYNQSGYGSPLVGDGMNVQLAGTHIFLVGTSSGNAATRLDSVGFKAGQMANVNTAATSTLQSAGSFSLSYVSKTAAYTATANDYTIDCVSGTYSITLPTAVGITGRIYVVKNSGTGAITITTTSSQTIDGVTIKTLNTQYSAYTVQSDGANWKILAAI